MKNDFAEIDELMHRKPFRVPEGYFEGFTEKMMSRLPEKQARPQGKKVRLSGRARPWLTAAAVFLGLVAVTSVFKKKTGNVYSDKDLIVKNISSQTISRFGEDARTEADFYDYLAEEYSNDNAEDFIDNFNN